MPFKSDIYTIVLLFVVCYFALESVNPRSKYRSVKMVEAATGMELSKFPHAYIDSNITSVSQLRELKHVVILADGNLTLSDAKDTLVLFEETPIIPGKSCSNTWSIVKLINGSSIGNDLAKCVNDDDIVRMPTIDGKYDPEKPRYHLIYFPEMQTSGKIYQLFTGDWTCSDSTMTTFHTDESSMRSYAKAKIATCKHVYYLEFRVGERDPIFVTNKSDG